MKKSMAFLLALIISISLVPLQAQAASIEEQIIDHNTGVYNAAPTGDSAARYYLKPSPHIESDSEEILDRAAEITRDRSGDLDKARAIHDWVCNNIWYDMDMAAKKLAVLITDQEALKTLENRRAICQGYANLTVALLRAAGIPAKYVEGRSNENGFKQSDLDDRGNHAWTEALIDGKWVIIDTTWDSGNRWENGRKTYSYGMMDRKYFNVSLRGFSRDHRIDDYFPYIGAVVEDGKLVKYGGPGDDLPDGIVSIGRDAFYYCNMMTRVVIPYGVDTIDSSAFMKCDDLVEVELPATVRTIGGSSLSYCRALESIHIPNGVTNIGGYAFYADTALQSVYIPPTVTEIGYDAFGECPSLLSVTIPPSVEKIGRNAFGYNGTAKVDNRRLTVKVEGFTIIGVPGSAAEDYATQHNFRFVALSASPTDSEVIVDGMAAGFEAYNIAGSNYFKLRDLAYVLAGTEAEFGVGWDAENNAISLFPGASYIPVGGEMAGKGDLPRSPVPTNSKILVDGHEVSLAAYKIGDNNYFRLRDIAAVFDFSVAWDGDMNKIAIDTSLGYSG